MEVKVHIIMALKYTSSKHVPSVCSVVHCHILGSSVLWCNKTNDQLKSTLDVDLVPGYWQCVEVHDFAVVLEVHAARTLAKHSNCTVSKSKKRVNINTEPA
jgi:hypothetical protein